MSRPIRFAAALAAAAIVSSAALFVHTQAQTPAPTQAATKTAVVAESITVYCDVNMLGRKHSAADKLTKLHAQKAAEGYTFSDMEAYFENSDIQGFFVTYTKR